MNKKSKRMIIAGICLVLVAGVIIVLALTKEKWSASDDVSESETNSQEGELIGLYEGLDEEGFYEHMSTLSIEEIFDEVNQLSNYGLEYPDFMYFAFVLVERAEEVSEDMILDTISNKENHENLRTLAADIIDYEYVDDQGIAPSFHEGGGEGIDYIPHKFCQHALCGKGYTLTSKTVLPFTVIKGINLSFFWNYFVD